jgi:uncharacterized protein (UPF0335 family)
MTNDTTNPQLILLVERIEGLNEAATGIADDIKDVYAEVKGVGFDPKIVRKIVSERAMERAALLEGIALLDVYRTAVGLDV